MPHPPWWGTFEEAMKPIEGDTMEEKKSALIKQLMLAGHWGPFEHPVITLGIEDMSRVTLAQITRHRIASFDIQSGRYAKMTMEQTVLPPSYTAEEVTSRQGGKRKLKGTPFERETITKGLLEKAFHMYDGLVDMGIPREDARYILPEAITIHGHMTLNARSLMHVIALRSFGDAQWEIRDLVADFLAEAKEWMPITFNIFEKRWMNKRTTIAP